MKMSTVTAITLVQFSKCKYTMWGQNSVQP